MAQILLGAHAVTGPHRTATSMYQLDRSQKERLHG